MLDRYDGRHPVSGIGSGEVGILVLEYAQLAGVAVDHLGKSGLEACDMRSALLREDIIAEAVDILLKGIYELERYLHLDIIGSALEIYRSAYRRLALIEILDICYETVRLVEDDGFLLIAALVRVVYRHLRIQICRLMQSAAQPVCAKSRCLKYLRIGSEVDGRTRLACLAYHGQQPVLQLRGRDAPLVGIMIYAAVPAYLDIKMC